MMDICPDSSVWNKARQFIHQTISFMYNIIQIIFSILLLKKKKKDTMTNYSDTNFPDSFFIGLWHSGLQKIQMLGCMLPEEEKY